MQLLYPKAPRLPPIWKKLKQKGRNDVALRIHRCQRDLLQFESDVSCTSYWGSVLHQYIVNQNLPPLTAVTSEGIASLPLPSQ